MQNSAHKEQVPVLGAEVVHDQVHDALALAFAFMGQISESDKSS